MRYLSPRALAVCALIVSSFAPACNAPKSSQSSANSAPQQSHKESSGAGRDLSADEAHGGHTLRKHVGRTDQQLRERLADERNISAASTYTDRHTAETFIASCLDDNRVRVQQWLVRDRHPNFVLDCVGDPAWPIGRTLRRGQSQPEPCSNATLVLKWLPPTDYFVLTSYPECR